MWLKSIELLNYKTRTSYRHEFTWGYNEISEPNEYGKSTLLEAIGDLLRTPASGSGRELQAKRTLGAEEDPVIRLSVVSGEREYLLERNAQEGSSRARRVGRPGRAHLPDRAFRCRVSRTGCQPTDHAGA